MRRAGIWYVVVVVGRQWVQTVECDIVGFQINVDYDAARKKR